MKTLDAASPYFIDFPGRVRALQAEMARAGIDAYLGSRLRTLSWTLGAFCPWRSFVVIPREGQPAAFIFVIDAARVADESWVGEDRVFGFAPMGGQDQIELVSEFLKDLLKGRKGRIGIESGMSNYLPEGHLTHYEFERFRDALPGSELVNAHDLVDRLSLVKDRGTINRFREASRIVDVGHQAVLEALRDGGWKGLHRDGDRGPRRPGHAEGRERMGMVVHRGQRDRLGIPYGPYGRGLHAGLTPRAPGRRAPHGRHPRHVHAGTGGPLS